MTYSKQKSYRRIDKDINIVKADVLGLADLIIHQFEFSIENLDSGDIDVIREVHELSDQINELNVYINQKCTAHLETQKLQPLELEVTLLTLKITDDLKLINEQVETIVRRIEIYIKQSTKQTSWGMPHIARCASLTIGMMNNALSAFSLLDEAAARQVIHLHHQVTEEYNFITGRLMDHMVNGPRSISIALDILYVAKAVERVANHAKNISHSVINIIQQYEKFNAIKEEGQTEIIE